MVKDYEAQRSVRRAINEILIKARALDAHSKRMPSYIKLAAAARAGHMLGVAYALHDLLVAIPTGSMYDLMKRHRASNERPHRPSARRGRW